ncbi:hypothetical protein ANO14919_103950 [Xylariales sp. No.14919]|nr:hypothetical protein ANO14919_103950 [Xylariales sp. No.14919]
MRPTSFSFNISPSGEEVEYSQVAAFVPYLHFERQSNLVELSSTIADVVNRTTKSSEKAATTPGDAIKLPAMDAKTLHKHLIRGYPNVTLSRRAGLDQYFYIHLGKRSRDKNQVVCKYQLHDPVSFVVDQLWIWIIDQDTIISCMPTSVEDTSMPTKLPVEGDDLIRPKSSRSHGGRARSRRGRLKLKGWLRGEHVKSKHDTSKTGHQPFSVQHSIFQYLRRMARPQIRSPYELASLITNHCANVFAEHDIPAEYQLLDIFERSNSKASDRVNHLLKSFQTSAVAGFDDVETQLSIHEETELFVELEDIQDELVILRAVLKDQESVTEELGKILDLLGLDRNQRPKMIDSMERMAKKTAERLRSLLDFKQKQANIALALTSINYTEQRAVQDEESTRQSRTLTLFTVVTIVFLPLSFLAAFFAIEIDVFPVDSNGKLNLDYVLKYLLGISAGFSVPFILIAFNLDRFTSWIASIRRHLPSVYWLMVVLGFLAILLPVVWTSPLGFTAKVGATVFVVLFSFFGIISVGIWRLGKVSTQK